jgi:peptidyl-prolyl cis-trans isomerase C
MTTVLCLPSIDGVPLQRGDETLSIEELRQRACTELLRQAAMRHGLLSRDDLAPVDGAVSATASAAIEALLERELQVPTPSDEDCRRYHAANAERYAVGEQVLARHVLFAVTPGTDVGALRQRAEACLLDLRGRGGGGDDRDRFAQIAATTSNCPSGAEGGQLGWLRGDDCAPEFARELFGGKEVGVLPRLVHSRFGLHVVEVLGRQPGVQPAYEQVRAAVAQMLHQRAYATALRQYLQLLAGQARVEGVDLEGASTPLVQ